MNHVQNNKPTPARPRRALLVRLDSLDTLQQLPPVLVTSEEGADITKQEAASSTRTQEPLTGLGGIATALSFLRFLVQWTWRRRVPVLLQMSAIECGATCLAMILTYYGRATTISEIRERCGPDRDGLSALALVKAAHSYGLRVRPIALKEIHDLQYAHMPAIVHWEFNHYLIIERWTSTWVEVVDPALGRLRLTAEEFDRGFTGIVLLLEPGTHFSKQSSTQEVNLRAYARSYIKQAPLALVQVLGASLLLQLGGLGMPLLTKVVVDHIIPLQLSSVLTIVGIGMLLLVLSQLVMTLLRSSLLIYIQARVDSQMMLGFFEHLLTLPLSFFLVRSSGDMLMRLNSNSVIRDTLSSQLISVLLDGSFALTYLGILVWQAPLYVVLVLGVGLLQVLLMICTRKPIQELARQELRLQGEAQGYVAEALTGMVTLKAAGAEQRALERWSNLFFDGLNASLRRNYLSSCISAFMGLLRAFSPMALLWVGTLFVINGQMRVGTMLALNALASAFLTSLSSLVSTGQSVQLVQSHLERVADVIEAEPEQQPQSVQSPPRLTGSVTLDSVCFRYGESAPEILHNVCLQIQAGQKIALVGRTGSGKSTLGKLLLGLHLPTEGEIFYDGLPLRSLDYQAVRAQFGVVMQEATIFSGSIRHNIAMNIPDMSMERVIRAADLAALHEDIMQMPMGYETMVSERGSALSGGQRQRLALARALAHMPAIILLDEATSSLDVMTEQRIERNLSALSCTQIIIAHRLSTIRHADLILVLDQGQIVERGTHEELLRCNGYYTRLIQSQLANGEVQA